MTGAFPPSAALLFVLTVRVVFGCQEPPWVLKRGDPGSSGVAFFNNTVGGAYMMARWTWRDSSGGFWDTRLRVTLNDEEIIGGGFTYSDQYENELASVRWFKTGMDGQIRWKHESFASPPDSWWMSSAVPRGNITWGFKNQITDGSWVFRVGNDTLEPKNIPNVDGWSQNMNRWKRSLKSPEFGAHGTRVKRHGGMMHHGGFQDYDSGDGAGFMEAIVQYFTQFMEMIQMGKDILSKLG